MTNSERVRRGYTLIPYCKGCSNTIEDLDRVFRFCGKARLIWQKLLGRKTIEITSRLPFTDWMTWNLNSRRTRVSHGAWKDHFATCLWWIWRWRNDHTFNKKELDLWTKMEMIRRYCKEMDSTLTNQLIVGLGNTRYVTKGIRWFLPPSAWLDNSKLGWLFKEANKHSRLWRSIAKS